MLQERKVCHSFCADLPMDLWSAEIPERLFGANIQASLVSLTTFLIQAAIFCDT